MRPLPPHRVRSQRSAAGAVLRPAEEPGICSRRPCPRSRWGEPRPAQPDHSGLGRLLPGRGVQPGLLPAGHLRVEAHLQVGQTHATRTSRRPGRCAAISASSTSSGTTGGSFGDRSLVSGRGEVAHLLKFSWTNIVRHQTVNGTASPDDPALTKYWTHGGDGSNLRWTVIRCACSNGRAAAARSAETPCSPPTSHPAPINNGRTGGRQSPARPSGTTTSCTTDGPGDPATRTVTKPAW